MERMDFWAHISETDRQAIKKLLSPKDVILFEGRVVDKNALTHIPRGEYLGPNSPDHITTMCVPLPGRATRLMVMDKKPKVPKALQRIHAFITAEEDWGECDRMLNEPEEYKSDMRMLVLSQLPPWDTAKSGCPCPTTLKMSTKAYSTACQDCLKRTFKELWLSKYTCVYGVHDSDDDDDYDY